MFNQKPSILLIGDTPGWAFDSIIDFIRLHLKSKFNIYYDYTIYNFRSNANVKSDINTKEIIHLDNTHYRKIIHYSSNSIFRYFKYKLYQYLNKAGFVKYNADGYCKRVTTNNQYDIVVFLDFYMDKDADFDFVKARKIIKGIFTAGFPPKGIQFATIDIKTFCKTYLSDADAIIAGADCVTKLYEPYMRNIFFAHGTYNERVFKPKFLLKTSSEFIVGWTGNPKRDFKGFYSHVVPAIELAKKKHPDIEPKFRFKGPLNTLPDFYTTLDLVIIASEADAGPLMFAEASLCGVPSISTKIGLPEMVIEDGVNGFFVERNIQEIAEKIIFLYENKEVLNKFKQRIRTDYIAKLGVEAQKQNWSNAFFAVLEK